MKLGMIAEPKEESFVKAAERGLAFLEFCINVGSKADEFLSSVPELVKYSNQTNVGIGSVGRWGADRILPDGSLNDEEVNLSYKLIDAASELSCANFVCGCNYVESLSYYRNCQVAIQ
ncbi:MAG TPA: hypothetical protein VGE40_02345, partial [Bacilli bacterium]